MSVARKSVPGPSGLPALRRAIKPLQAPFLVAVAYFLGAEAAFYIGTLSDKIFALFWPPNVILFCALVIVPPRQWGLYIAAVLPAHVIAEHGVGMPAPQMLVAFATNCMMALSNAFAVRLLLGGPPWLGTRRKAILYIVVVIGVCPALSAFGGAFVPILGGGAPSDYWLYWAHWYLANALPNLTVGPVFLIWFSERTNWWRWRPLRPQVEPAILTFALVGICAVVATTAGQLVPDTFVPVLLLAPLPLVLWAAVRFGEKGASGAILIVTVILTWRTLHDPAIFKGQEPERNVLALQLFLTALAIPVLLLGAVIDELRRASDVTRKLTASLMTAQDDERRRIARDLHDSTGQNLIAATLIAAKIQRLLPPSAERILQQLEDVLQQAIREIRTVSYLLHPPLLDEAGLDLALRDYVAGYVDRSGIKVDLDIMPDLDRLAPNTELALFRVVQEALANVARHSESTTAQIALGQQTVRGARCVVLTIEDFGRGVPRARGLVSPIRRGQSASSGRGIGLDSMRERVHQVGGHFDIRSTAGGTVVRAVIPVTALDAN